MLLSFHFAILSFSTKKVGFYLVTLYVIVFILKLTRFHFFMTKPSKEHVKMVGDSEFQRDALVLSCLSLFLEVFGHIFISLVSGLGYATYTMNRKFMLLIIVLCTVTHLTRNIANQLLGKRPFAKYVAPSLKVEGVVVSLMCSTLTSYCLYLLSVNDNYNTYVLKIDLNSYLIFGQVTGFLSIIGDLLMKFLKRCANMEEFEDRSAR